MSRLCLVACLLLVVAAPASAQWWFYVDQLQYTPTEEVTILAVPDGAGPPLSEARRADGTVVDATILLRLVTDDHTPLVHYPPEDIWLDFPPSSGTLLSCPIEDWVPDHGIFIADGPTDSDGWTTFALPLPGGGWSVGPATLYITGAPATWYGGGPCPPLAMRINSPDITGEREVNLADLQNFAQDYLGSYDFRSDLVSDGVLNLADLGVFARHYGVACVP